MRIREAQALKVKLRRLCPFHTRHIHTKRHSMARHTKSLCKEHPLWDWIRSATARNSKRESLLSKALRQPRGTGWRVSRLRDSLRLTYANHTFNTGTHNARTSAKGLRYHAGAGKQFTGLFAAMTVTLCVRALLLPVRIPPLPP